MDSVRPFESKFKLYVFKNRNRAKLTIKINEDTAATYLWTLSEMKSMLLNWKNDWNGKANGVNMFFGPKRLDPSQPPINDNIMVRISAMSNFGIEHRVTYKDMEKLEEDFFHQMTNDMPWD